MSDNENHIPYVPESSNSHIQQENNRTNEDTNISKADENFTVSPAPSGREDFEVHIYDNFMMTTPGSDAGVQTGNLYDFNTPGIDDPPPDDTTIFNYRDE